MAWNPFDRPDRVWRDLETSRQRSPRTVLTDENGHVIRGGDELGPPEAAVAFQQWTAGDRLAWFDMITTRTMAKTTDGDDTVRAGTVQLVHVMLTAREARGFPAVPVTRTDEDGAEYTVAEAFDPRNEEHLRLLPAEVFEELYRHAADVQPPPGGKGKGKGKAADPDAPVLMVEDAPAAGEDEDPTPTP